MDAPSCLLRGLKPDVRWMLVLELPLGDAQWLATLARAIILGDPRVSASVDNGLGRGSLFGDVDNSRGHGHLVRGVRNQLFDPPRHPPSHDWMAWRKGSSFLQRWHRTLLSGAHVSKRNRKTMRQLQTRLPSMGASRCPWSSQSGRRLCWISLSHG